MRNISSLVAIAIVAMTTFASAEAAKRKPAAADTASNRSVNDNGRYNANAYDPAGNYRSEERRVGKECRL